MIVKIESSDVKNKTRRGNVMTREELILAAQDLNEKLGLEPSIDTMWETEEIEEAVKMAGQLVDPTDELQEETQYTLELLGLSFEHKEELKESRNVGDRGSKEKKKDTKKPKEKHSPVKKKDEKSSIKLFGISPGTKSYEAVEMFTTGKHTMKEIKEKLGTTYYILLKKLRQDYTVVIDDKKRIKLSK